MSTLNSSVVSYRIVSCHLAYCCTLNCTATSRQDVVVRHDDEPQKPRRHWDDQDVSYLLSVLDNAELSSSCNASCSGSVSQTSCDAADATQHSPVRQLMLLAGSDDSQQQTNSTGLKNFILSSFSFTFH